MAIDAPGAGTQTAMQYLSTAACDNFALPGVLMRNSFNADFTRLAVTARPVLDSSTAKVGYLTETAFTDLSGSASSGYGESTPRHGNAAYSPSGQVFFVDAGSQGSSVKSVDGQGGGLRTEVPSVTGDIRALHFPDRKTDTLDVQVLFGQVTRAFSRDGTLRATLTPQGLALAPTAQATSAPPAPLAKDLANTWLSSVIDAKTVLMHDRTQLYKVTVSANGTQVTKLLPESDRSISAPVLSLDGTQVAFIA